MAIEESLNRLMATIRSLELLAQQEEHMPYDFDVACRLADDGQDEIEHVRKRLDVFLKAKRESGAATSSGQEREAQLRVVK
jgi:hypothetical protein